MVSPVRSKLWVANQCESIICEKLKKRPQPVDHKKCLRKPGVYVKWCWHIQDLSHGGQQINPMASVRVRPFYRSAPEESNGMNPSLEGLVIKLRTHCICSKYWFISNLRWTTIQKYSSFKTQFFCQRF